MILNLDFEDRQQMRDRWLRDAFAVSLPSPTGDSEQINQNEDGTGTATTNSIDEEEAARLLIDYGISEDKAKVRLQVKIVFMNFQTRNIYTGNSSN